MLDSSLELGPRGFDYTLQHFYLKDHTQRDRNNQGNEEPRKLFLFL